MKKLVMIGIAITLLSVAINFYVTNYYCAGDDYCLYTIGDGITENIVYLALTFVLASLMSLIGKSVIPWIITFLTLTIMTMFSSQACSVVGCFGRESMLTVTIGVTLLVALASNLVGKFKK